MRTLVAVAALSAALAVNGQTAFAETSASATASPMFAYLEKIGMPQLLAERREASRKATIELLNKFIDQVKAQDPSMSDETILKLRSSMSDMADTITNAYSVDEALMVYAEPFDRTYSPTALRKKIKEMSTPDNMREIRVVNEAVMKMSEFCLRKQNEAAEKVMTTLLTQVKDIVREEAKIRKKRADIPSPPETPVK
jgi:hypothetical protein